MINLKNVVFINQKLKYDHFINRISGVLIDPVSKKKITFFGFSMIFLKISDVSIEQ